MGLPCTTRAQTIPTAPTNLTAGAVSMFQINLSWSDTSTNEGGFKIERSPDGINFTQIAQTSTNATAYRNTALFPNTTYFYRVRAFNSGGASAYTTITNAVTPAPGCPLSVSGWGYNADGEVSLPTFMKKFPETAIPVAFVSPILTPFQQWQTNYFGSTTNASAAANADPDGDGQNNMTEFLTGTDPTNNASAFRIISVTRQGSDINVIWSAATGHTNAVQTAPNLASSYSDISSAIVITSGGTTNYLDAGAVTNSPTRFYRVRLVP